MTNQERLDHLRWLDIGAGYHEDRARWERATSWLHGTGHGSADFHTRQAEKLRAIHTETCKRWGLTDRKIEAEFNHSLNP